MCELHIQIVLQGPACLTGRNAVSDSLGRGSAAELRLLIPLLGGVTHSCPDRLACRCCVTSAEQIGVISDQ